MTIVAELRIQYRQLLDARGQATATLPEFAQDRQDAFAMYRLMTPERVSDTKAVTCSARTVSALMPPASVTKRRTSASAPRSAPEHVLAPVYRMSEICATGVATRRATTSTCHAAHVAFPSPPRRCMPPSLSFDHRCITGGEACRFPAALIADLEKPV